MPVSDDDLTRWEELAAVATEGPWEHERAEVWACAGSLAVCDAYRDTEASDDLFHDAAFIASARTAVPALVAEVHAIRTQLARARELLDLAEQQLTGVIKMEFRVGVGEWPIRANADAIRAFLAEVKRG